LNVHRHKPLGTKALMKVLRYHDSFCTIHTLAQFGRCSCGRNQALAELALLLRQLTPIKETQTCSPATIPTA
jgi:hypothetical protein